MQYRKKENANAMVKLADALYSYIDDKLNILAL